jgi:hypothetical protein
MCKKGERTSITAFARVGRVFVAAVWTGLFFDKDAVFAQDLRRTVAKMGIGGFFTDLDRSLGATEVRLERTSIKAALFAEDRRDRWGGEIASIEKDEMCTLASLDSFDLADTAAFLAKHTEGTFSTS